MDFRHSFGPGDITTVAILPNAMFILDEVSNFSITSHFDKKAIRRLNHRLPVGWATGSATIAGSLVCAQMTHGALWKIRRYAGTIRYHQEQALASTEDVYYGIQGMGEAGEKISAQADNYAASIQPQQLPPFHLMFMHFNQDGQMGLARLYNVTFTDYAEVKGTQNRMTEETLQYQALFYEQLRLRRSLTTTQMQELLGEKLPEKQQETGFFNDPRRPQLVDELADLSGVSNIGEYLVQETQEVVDRTSEGEATSISVADQGDVLVVDRYRRDTGEKEVEKPKPEMKQPEPKEEPAKEEEEPEEKEKKTQRIENQITYTILSRDSSGTLEANQRTRWLALEPKNKKLYLSSSATKPESWKQKDIIAQGGSLTNTSFGQSEWSFTIAGGPGFTESSDNPPTFVNYSKPDLVVTEGSVRVQFPTSGSIALGDVSYLPPPGTYRGKGPLLTEEAEITTDDGVAIVDPKTPSEAPLGGTPRFAAGLGETTWESPTSQQLSMNAVGITRSAGVPISFDPTTGSEAITRMPIPVFQLQTLYDVNDGDPAAETVTTTVSEVFNQPLETPLDLEIGFQDPESTSFTEPYVEEKNSGAQEVKMVEGIVYDGIQEDAQQFKFPSLGVIVEVAYNNRGNKITRVDLVIDQRRPLRLEYQDDASPRFVASSDDSKVAVEGVSVLSVTLQGWDLEDDLLPIAESSFPTAGSTFTLKDGTELQIPEVNQSVFESGSANLGIAFPEQSIDS